MGCGASIWPSSDSTKEEDGPNLELDPGLSGLTGEKQQAQLASEKALLHRFGARPVDFSEDCIAAEAALKEFLNLEEGAAVFESDFFAGSPDGILKSDFVPKVLMTVAGEPYYRPDGWTLFHVVPAQDLPDEGVDGWPVAYHGTSIRRLRSFLDQGLRKPGAEIVWRSMSGQMLQLKSQRGSAGAGSGGAAYVTPSLWVAAHPLYSRFEEIDSGHWVQLVLQLRVKPGSYIKQHNTLANCHWDPRVLLDPNLVDHRSVEWVVDNPEDTRLAAVLVRHVGSGADEQVHGKFAAQFSSRKESPAAEWQDQLSSIMRAAGYLLPVHGSLTVDGREAVWELPVDILRQFEPRQRLLSPLFAVKGAEQMSLEFFPKGNQKQQDAKDGECSVYVQVFQPGLHAVTLSVGSHHETFVYKFKGEENRGWTNFCTLEQQLRRPSVLQLRSPKLKLAAELVHSPSTNTVAFGTLEVTGNKATWMIPESEKSWFCKCFFCMTPPFTLNGVTGLFLKVYPSGDNTTSDGNCSFRICVPHKGMHYFDLAVNSARRRLAFDFSGSPLEDRGWKSFCDLQSLSAPVSISATLLQPPGSVS